MAEKRKSLIDEALLESEQIKKAFETNAKEILTRTMGSEIEEMVKESLEEKDSNGLKEDENEEEALELLDLDDASSAGDEDLDIELGDEEMEDMEDMGDMEDMEDMDSDELEIVDLTDEDDDTVVNVFKKMADEDEIEVVQTDGGVEIKDNETGAEYKIELGGDSEMEMDDEDMEDMGDMEDMDSDEIEMDDEDMDSDEIEYQIELGDDEDEEDDMDDDMSEGDYMEDGMEENRGAHTLGNASRIANRKSSDINSNRVKMGESKKPKFLKLVNENKVLKNKINSTVSENETLKEDYNKMVDALKQFRDKLNEVAVFNSNLTYSVRLFTENTTTKEEKLEIIKRFDEVKTLKESKGIYKSLVKEISKKETIKESIDEKLNSSKTVGSATEITESKVYVDPQMEKMKKLWSYDYKK